MSDYWRLSSQTACEMISLPTKKRGIHSTIFFMSIRHGSRFQTLIVVFFISCPDIADLTYNTMVSWYIIMPFIYNWSIYLPIVPILLLILSDLILSWSIYHASNNTNYLSIWAQTIAYNFWKNSSILYNYVHLKFHIWTF